MCHVSLVTSHLSLTATATATDPPPAKSPIIEGWIAKTQNSKNIFKKIKKLILKQQKPQND